MTGKYHPIAMLRAELQGRTAPRYVAGPYYRNRDMRRSDQFSQLAAGVGSSHVPYRKLADKFARGQASLIENHGETFRKLAGK